MEVISYDDIILKDGAHATREEGMCFMEASAFIGGAEHTDKWDGICPTLGAFLRNWNDALNDTDRQRLKPYLRLVIGTANDGFAERRSWMACDWLIRTFTPAWLDKAGLCDHAATLRGLAELTDEAGVCRAMPYLDATGDAARAAPGDAPGDAARAAARNAAGNAARAAWDVRDVRDAVRVVAWDAALTARDAVRAVAWDALQDTVAELQSSAFQLLDRMLMLGLESRDMPVYEIADEPRLAHDTR